MANVSTHAQSCRNLRSSTHGSLFTIISMLLALMGFFVSYIAAAASLSIPALCATASALVHYFLLAALCWKLVEAIVIYRKTTDPPKPDMKYGIVISSLASWCKYIIGQSQLYCTPAEQHINSIPIHRAHPLTIEFIWIYYTLHGLHLTALQLHMGPT